MRIVTFADGFVSTAPPAAEGQYQQSSEVVNLALNEPLLTMTSEYRSAFIDFEISRTDIFSSFVETGRLTLVFKDNLWNFSVGLTQGDEILNSDEPQGVSFSIENVAGQGILKYTSNEMGASYVGSIKMIISKVKAL